MSTCKGDRACAGCPWLRLNQTPEAIAQSPTGGGGMHWFDPRNLLRHWQHVSKAGGMLPCHETDPNAPFYGGKPAKAGHRRICVGLSVLARREVTAFLSAGQNFDRYRRLPGKRFTAVGLAAWAARLYFGGASFHAEGETYVMPKRVVDDPRVGVPWADGIHDAK